MYNYNYRVSKYASTWHTSPHTGTSLHYLLAAFSTPDEAPPSPHQDTGCPGYTGPHFVAPPPFSLFTDQGEW